MKFVALTTALLATSVSSFTQNQPAVSRITSLEATSSRGEFLAQLAGAAAVAGIFPGDAFALGPPKSKATPAPLAASAGAAAVAGASPGIIDVSSVVIDKEVFGSLLVQKALKDVTDYSAIINEMKNTLSVDANVDLEPVIKKEFDYGKVRADINELQSAFDKKTQKTTKILADIILVDLAKLEESTIRSKDGTERGSLDVKTVLSLLDKIYYSFDEILQCAKTDELA